MTEIDKKMSLNSKKLSVSNSESYILVRKWLNQIVFLQNTIFIWEYFIRKALIKSQKSAENLESVISQKYFCDFFGRWNNNFA